MKVQFVLLAVIAGCGGTQAKVKCSTNAQCTTPSKAGICVPDENVCAVVDSSCPSGYRYDPTAGKGAVCLPAPGDMSAPQDANVGDMAVQVEVDMVQFQGSTDLAGGPPDLSPATDYTWTVKTDGNAGVTYNTVAGTAPDNVWISGTDVAQSSASFAARTVIYGTGGVVTHGSEQSQQLWVKDANGTVASVSGNFIVGLSGTGGSTQTTQYSAANTITFYAIAGIGAVGGWAGGSQGALMHLTNGLWGTVLNIPTAMNFYGIWADATTDVYAVGAQYDSTLPGDRIAIYHSVDGLTFSRLTLPNTYAGQLWAIWGASQNDIYAVGDDRTILHYDGTTWTVQLATNSKSETLRAISGSGSKDVFAVGDSGLILHSAGDGNWVPEISGTTNGLLGVYAAGPSDIYVVGAAGTILHGVHK